MGFYQNCILSHLIHLTMRRCYLVVYLQRVVPAAEGRVLQIGVGSALTCRSIQARPSA